MRRDVYQEITNTIVAQLEQGVRPWHRPWKAANMEGRVLLPLRHNGAPYRGVNILSLWMQAIEKGYASPRWMTFKQAIDLGGGVRKGEKGTLTVYADSLKRSEIDDRTGEETTAEIHYMKGYSVFNVEQIDGLPEAYYDRPKMRVEALPRISRAEAFFKATGACIRHGGNRAFYSPSSDHIQMPPFEAFESPEGYYATLAHEASHWTKHKKRLARDFGRKRWGDEGYAMEELVAEIGAAFLCATLELEPAVREEHASYLASWLKVLKQDDRAIFRAAGHAQRAADYLCGLQPARGEAAA